jgi:hypothetical protein
MTKVERYTQYCLQLVVVAEQDVVVGSNRGKLREHSLNALQSPKSTRDRDGQDLPDEANPEFPVGGCQAVPAALLATDNEVNLQVTDSLSVRNDRWPVVDVGFLVTWWSYPRTFAVVPVFLAGLEQP